MTGSTSSSGAAFGAAVGLGSAIMVSLSILSSLTFTEGECSILGTTIGSLELAAISHALLVDEVEGELEDCKVVLRQA